jgi:protocatechuate 3,4-dioxygenase beta subunit
MRSECNRIEAKMQASRETARREARPPVWLIVAFVAFAINAFADIRRGQIAGRVLDDNGQPIEAVLVDAWTSQPGDQTRTDKNGAFILKGLAPNQQIELRFSKKGFSPHYILKQDTGVGDLVIHMNDRTYFEGVVRSPEGKPLANVEVRGDSGPKKADHLYIDHVWTQTTTDAGGHYKLFVSPDDYHLQVRVPDSGVGRIAATIAEGEHKTQEIQLAAGISFVAKFVDSESAVPIAGVKMWVEHQKQMTVTSNDHGIVTIPNLFPGRLAFIITSPDHARSWSEDNLQPNGRSQEEAALVFELANMYFDIKPDMKPVTITMEKAVVVTGKVVDPHGKPRGGAMVVPIVSETGEQIVGPSMITITRSDGTFEMKLPASIDLECSLIARDGPPAHRRDFADGASAKMKTAPGQHVENVKIELTHGATVKGRVVDKNGQPISNREVKAFATDHLEARYDGPSTHTDKDGKFELTLIRPTEQSIQVAPFVEVRETSKEESAVIVDLKPGEVKDGVELTADEF